MAQPALRIDSARVASDLARRLQTPSEVVHFEAAAAEWGPGRAFLETEEWAAIRTGIMGDGTTSIGRPQTLDDMARLMLWHADGYFSEAGLTDEARDAYIHAAAEIRAFGRTQARLARAAAPARVPAAVDVDTTAIAA